MPQRRQLVSAEHGQVKWPIAKGAGTCRRKYVDVGAGALCDRNIAVGSAVKGGLVHACLYVPIEVDSVPAGLKRLNSPHHAVRALKGAIPTDESPQRSVLAVHLVGVGGVLGVGCEVGTRRAVSPARRGSV